MRTDIIIVNDFYKNPEQIRDYALSLQYYYPYERKEDVEAGRVQPTWMSAYFRKPEDCPFKSSPVLIDRLERIVGEEIDMDHWSKNFPVDEQQNLLENYKAYDRTCRWNCCFHVKFLRHEAGTGVHNHVTDTWNSVGELGWAGIIYLNKDAPLESGLKLWRNKFGKPYEWMSSKARWEQIDSFSNMYNRLILCRGYLPHSGGPAFGDTIHTGRLFQTFFFKTKPRVIEDYEGPVVR